jgi:hypothetical protein
MSLKTELRLNRPARIFIDEWFPGLRHLSKRCNDTLRELPVPDHPHYAEWYAYSVIGTAVDYRIRSFFTNAPHRATTIQEGLTAIWATSVQTDTGWIENAFSFNGEYRDLTERFNSWSARFLLRSSAVRRVHSKSLETTLCRYCVVLLAWIDHARRGYGLPFFYAAMQAGVFDPKELMGSINHRWVEDVARLAHSFRARNAGLVSNFSTAATGCGFAGSADVGGADCDMIVDGCLIEIKATIKDQITTENLRQIVGYCLLDYGDEFSIRRAAIHFVRQGIEFDFDLSDLLPPSHSIQEVRSAFRTALRAGNASDGPSKSPRGRLRSSLDRKARSQ